MIRGILRCRILLPRLHQQPTMSSAAVTVLTPPVKSTSDKKDYRVIKLNNGLQALLISDTRYSLEKLDEEERTTAAAGDDGDDGEDDEEDMEGESSGEDEDDEDEDMSYKEEGDEDDDDQGGSAPKRARKSAATSSGLKKSAAGLCINMGSFSDPEDVPGLAHFLEHMVFMGSKKYPDENSFDNFIQKAGGYDNASTDCESTVFYFETQRKSFKEGLDRFAQFFIHPLMNKGSMQREREAVDSEFEMALQSDYNRKQQLFSTLTKENHPMGKFMWGNTKSLSPKDMDDVEMHKRLHAFKNRHYTAQSMTLAVQAQETLDTIQDWVVQSFSDVPNNELKKETFEHLPLPFDTPAFSKVYKVVPVQNAHHIDLNWALPAMKDKYRIKPLHYLSWVIGHEGKGSLVSYLRDRVWALSLSAGNAGDGYEFNSTHSVFSIGIELTQEGFENTPKVLEAVFSYLRMLTEAGPSERIYGEIKRIEELNFAHGEEKQVSENVETLCETMAYYPSDLILTGDELMFEYNAEEIKKCTNYLKPETVNVMLTAREFASECDQVEPYFSTKFNCSEIPSEWRDTWINAKEGSSEMFLPEPNKFIADDTSLKVLPADVPKLPVKILDCKQGELFYRPDDIFKQPRAYYQFYIVSPSAAGSARNFACLDVLAYCVAQIMTEDTYPADLAQLAFQLFVGERGLVVKISGLNDKLPALLEVILDKLHKVEKLCTEQMFSAVREQTKKSYYNGFIKPMKLVREVRLSVLQDGYNNAVEKHAIISEVTMSEVMAYTREFLSKVYIQGLAQGNITKEEAVTCFRMFDRFGGAALEKKDLPEIQCRRLESGARRVRVEGINRKDGNTVVTNYYQEGPGTISSHAVIELVDNLMAEPVFDELRTKEQLGYSVFSMLRNSFGVSGFTITVCAQASKFSPDHIDGRIEHFLDWFLKTKLAEMKDEEYQEKIQTLIKSRKAADVTLSEEVSRNWQEIHSGEYVFNRYEKDIAVFETLQSKTVAMDALKRLLKDGDLHKKLSVQIVGNAEGEDATDGEEEETTNPDGVFQLVYAKGEEETKDGYAFIQNARDYRQKLELYPVTKMVDQLCLNE